MIKRYLLVLAPGEEPGSVSRVVSWIVAHRNALASNFTILTTSTISNRLEAIEDIQKTVEMESVSLDIETLTNVSLNPLDCVSFSKSDDEKEDGETNSNADDETTFATIDRMADLLASSRILTSPQDFVGVVYFSSLTGSTANQGGLNNLLRVCTQCNIPIAMNDATATLCLQASTKLRRLAVLLFNPVAGQRPAATDLKEIHSILGPTYSIKVVYTEKDLDVAEQASGVVSWMTRYQEKHQKNLGSLDEYTPPLLIASGGDGTVSAIAGATMNTGITVGVIPRGTANAFSVALGIPTDVDGACRNILTGQVRQVDGATVTLPSPVLDINEEESADNKRSIAWINHAGLGFEAGLVDNTTRELKNVFGNVGYTIGAAQQLLSQKPFECTFQIDGDPSSEQTVTTTVVTIGNVDPPSSIFAQGFGQVIPDDGLFDVTIATPKNVLDGLEGLATLAINSVIKDNVGSNNLLCLRCRKIRVACSPAQKMLMDGEVIEVDEHPVEFECIPNALKVLVPLPGGVGDEGETKN